MGNQLQTKGGAQPSRPTKYGVLWQGRFYGGIVTQRSPLRGNLGHVEEEWYGNQNDLMIGGLNSEISSKLTAIRRPGSTIYNDQTFPTINRFYENRTNTYNASQTIPSENIQVVCDTPSTVYDCTGPSTKKTIFTKTAGAGSTYFQSVGNSLYFSDGVDRKKLLTPSLIWAADTAFTNGQWILDPNGNIQEVIATNGSAPEVLNILSVTAATHFFAPHKIITVTFSGTFPTPSPTSIVLAGILSPLNGYDGTVGPGGFPTFSGNQLVFVTGSGAVGTVGAGGTGTFTPPQGVSGGSAPTWNITAGGTTTDGDLTWQNMGLPVQNWQIAPPTTPPTISNSSSPYSFWQPNSTFAFLSAVLDPNGNIEVYVAGGTTTGTAPPVWQTAINSLTSDGTIYWRNYGRPGVWQPNYDTSNYITTTNGGAIVDSNGNLQVIDSPTGTTGSTEPTWNVTQGGTTTDGAVTWVNCGPGTVVFQGSRQWAYSYHGVDGSVSTASPISTILYGVLSTTTTFSINLAGAGTNDPQCDQIWIWRTVLNGSVLFFDGETANPSAGTSAGTNWSFTDTVPDVSLNVGSALNEFIEAPIALSSNPPPVGLTALTYHLGCVFGAVGNLVQYSDGPLVTSGNGNTAWNPENVFVFPSTVVRLFPTSSGLIVFTSSDIYIIQGLNTTASPLFATPFLQYIGLVSYDAFAINGGIVFLYTSDNQVITLDPSSGVSEVGFPIGDQFGPNYGTGTFTPSTAHVTWHIAQSQDKGLYVSDFEGSWWRMCPTPSPETGTTWSPRAQIVVGFSAVQSVETTPGTHNLLLGPRTSGQILQRNYQVYSDLGNSYPAWAVLGSIVLAQPGQLAMVESLTTDSIAIGTPITLGVQLDEISSYTGVGSAGGSYAGNRVRSRRP